MAVYNILELVCPRCHKRLVKEMPDGSYWIYGGLLYDPETETWGHLVCVKEQEIDELHS